MSGWTMNSPCITISQEQYLLVSFICVSCVSFMESSAILLCSNLFQHLYYLLVSCFYRCHINFNFTYLQCNLWLENCMGTAVRHPSPTRSHNTVPISTHYRRPCSYSHSIHTGLVPFPIPAQSFLSTQTNFKQNIVIEKLTKFWYFNFELFDIMQFMLFLQ